ncbi:MAG: hypothetical protein Kow00121_59630 [Elainellaceae cyanobacterium]
MNQALVNALRNLHHSGQSGFEGLIAKLLEALTDRHFHLAQAGTQLGRDMSASGPNTNVIAVECKRYGEKTELNERELLGEIVQVAKAIPDLDLWVLVTSRGIPSQLHESLRSTAHDYGITYLPISTGDGTPSSLEILCAQAIDQMLEYIEDESDKDNIQQPLQKISEFTQFNQKVERLRNKFISSLIGYNFWKTERNRFFLQCLQSKTESRAEFGGQAINLEEEGIKLIKREEAWINLNQWFNEWKNNRQPLAVLGEEGDGKTWSVASWLSYKLKCVNGFPPVLFLSSTSVSNNDPEILIAETIAKHLPSLNQEQVKKRLKRWTERGVNDVPLFLIVLDGINERRSREWWRILLDKLAAQPWGNQVAVLITCRSAYWKRYFKPIFHLQVKTYTLLPYNDRELNEALSHHNLKRSDIQNSLLNLICKPRYFDLMVKYREKVAETGDVTVERLIYEDWRDRLERKRNILLDDDHFKELICGLALKYQEKSKYITEQDVDDVLPRFIQDKLLLLEELQTGGILQHHSKQSYRQVYQVNTKFLTLGFGLLLVDQLEEANESPEQGLSEAIAGWLEPHAEMDIKAAICGFAALHALSLCAYPKQAKIALLQAWVSSRNPEQTAERDFVAYMPIDPQCYIELAEVVWTDAAENAWAQELLMQAFLRWCQSPNISSKLHSAFKRWLGFFHIYGVASLRDDFGEGTKRIKQEIAERLGCQPQAGQEFTFGSYIVTAIEDDGLLRLGRVALAVISHLPRGSFLHAIATGCLAEAIMGALSKHDLFTWLFRSSSDPLWEEVQEETRQLFAIKNRSAQQAAYRLLSFEGSREAYQLKQALPRNLVPVNSIIEQHKQDPCNSWLQCTQAECEACLLRSDLSSEQITRKLKPHCINPDLLVPDNLGQRLESLAEFISIQNVRSNVGESSDDHSLGDYEPVLCAYAPTAIVDLVRRITCHIEEREDLALHYLVFKLNEYSLLFDVKEQESIYSTWKRLVNRSHLWSDKEKLSEAFLFKLVLKFQTAEEQLYHLIQRPGDTIDLLDYARSFLPINNWNLVQQHLGADATTRTIQRILWFLSCYPKEIPEPISYELILPLLNHEDSLIRASTLQILYLSEDQKLIKVFTNGEWNWGDIDQNENWQEIHWGSLLLCKYATQLPYIELHSRVHPKYLGYAVQCRGMVEEEIKRFSEDIQSTWVKLGSEIPDLPIEFPPFLITASILEYEDLLMIHRIKIIDNLSSQKVTFLSRDASWGGVDKGNSTDWKEIMSLNSDEQRQTIRKQTVNEVDKIIKQQSEAGNPWFAQHLFSNVIEQVIHKYPDLVKQWLTVILTDSSLGKRYLNLGYSFYEVLCTILLKVDPERGISLYWQLQEPEIKIDTRDEYSNIKLLDYALFQALSSENVKRAWKEKLEACKTDSELLELAILSQYGNARSWLWSVVKQGTKSTVAIEKSRALMLLAFIQEEEAFELMNSLRENQPDTWVKDLLELSCQLWKRNNWAMYWYRRFLSMSSDITSWTAFRLFLQCVDSRFWYWRRQIETELLANNYPMKRFSFLEDNFETIKNTIQKNEKPLREKFLGHKGDCSRFCVSGLKSQ